MFEVTGALGAGGMGETCLASDVGLRRDVALEILPATLAADTDRVVLALACAATSGFGARRAPRQPRAASRHSASASASMRISVDSGQFRVGTPRRWSPRRLLP